MRRVDIKKIVFTCASIMTMLSAPIAFGGTQVDGKAPVPPPPVTPPPEESWVHGDFGLNIVNEYISRGLVFENEGAILEPYLDLYFTVYEGSDTAFINKITLNLGLWDSFHSRKTQATSTNLRYWFESDFNPGVSITFLKRFTLSPNFFAFTSPSDAFITQTGLNVKLAFDDTDFLKAFALHPYATILFELNNGKVGSGKATSQGQYYELGVGPSYTAGPVTLTLPVVFGFGSNNFYARNAGFGYGSVGLNASYALPFPKKLGAWSINGGLAYYYLGNGLYDFNSPAIRHSDHNNLFYSGGFGMTF
jgi:hypothetical protein